MEIEIDLAGARIGSEPNWLLNQIADRQPRKVRFLNYHRHAPVLPNQVFSFYNEVVVMARNLGIAFVFVEPTSEDNFWQHGINR